MAKAVAEVDRQLLYAAHTWDLHNFPDQLLLLSIQLGRPGNWGYLVGKLYGKGYAPPTDEKEQSYARLKSYRAGIVLPYRAYI
jgi:hypothetical protein